MAETTDHDQQNQQQQQQEEQGEQRQPSPSCAPSSLVDQQQQTTSPAKQALKQQACLNCSKRKVKCDRVEPCANCKRRKETCQYPDISPAERIRYLEAIVRNLGGDPDGRQEQQQQQVQQVQAQGQVQGNPQGRNCQEKLLSIEPGTKTEVVESRTTTPSREAAKKLVQLQDPGASVHADDAGESIIIEEDGQPVYLESYAWYGWSTRDSEHNSLIEMPLIHRGRPRAPAWAMRRPDALEGVLTRCAPDYLASRHPSRRISSILIDKYWWNCDPILKISFIWETDALLRSAVDKLERRQPVPPSQHALLFAVYLISALSLTEDECLNLLAQGKSSMLSDFQLACEQALVSSNFLCASDFVLLQALTLYMLAGLERVSSKSLWSLMGTVIRNAERLGLQRDGTILGLSPLETEKRRRLWWQLQHIDVALAILSGSTPLTIMADWDTQLPLNIEDDDLDASTTETPKERPGLTSISYPLWTYFVVREQRTVCRTDKARTLGFSWAIRKTMPFEQKLALFNHMQEGLNKQFLQFCDPIKPLDFLIQLGARSFLCAMRRLILHPHSHNDTTPEKREARRKELIDVCSQCLEYDIAANTQASIKRFHWRIKGYFQWSAFCLIVEAAHLAESPHATGIWSLFARVYAANRGLSDVAGSDHRKIHAAEMLKAAWRPRERFLYERHRAQPKSFEPPQKPPFLVDLESRLAESAVNTAGSTAMAMAVSASRKRKMGAGAGAGAGEGVRKGVPPPMFGAVGAGGMGGGAGVGGEGGAGRVLIDGQWTGMALPVAGLGGGQVQGQGVQGEGQGQQGQQFQQQQQQHQEGSVWDEKIFSGDVDVDYLTNLQIDEIDWTFWSSFQ